MKRIGSFVSLIFLLFTTAQGQHTKYFDDSPMLFREGLELLRNEQYGSAKVKMEAFIEASEDSDHSLVGDANYYALLCAVQLKEKNAADKIRQFSDAYSSSGWMPRVAFLEGRLLFEQKRYSEALTAFEKVDSSDLPSFEKTELDYKKGFCLMRQNKLQEALGEFGSSKEQQGIYKQPSIYYYAHLQYIMENDEDAAQHFELLKNAVQYKKIVPLYLIHINHRNGRFDEVIRDGEQAVQLADSKRKAEIAQLVADAWYKTGDYSKAINYYNTALAYGRNQLSRVDHYQKGISHFKLEQYPEAILHLEQVAGIDEDALAQNSAYHLGMAYNQTDQKVFARNAFLKAHKLNLNAQIAEDALFKYASLSMETNPDPYNEAVGLLENYLETNQSGNRKTEANQLIVQLYLHTKNYDAALKSLENNTSRNPELEKIYQKLAYSTGLEHFQRGDFPQAIQYFGRIKNIRNSDYAAAANFWTAESQYQLGQYVEARQSLQNFMSNRNASTSNLMQKASYLSGYIHFQLKQYQQALQQFKQFLTYPNNDVRLTYDAWLRTGDCHFIRKEYSASIDAYNKVINQNQNGADYALFQKGLAYGALGKFNDKINSFDQLTNRYPTSVYFDQALYEMGSTSLITNDPRSAIAFFDKLVKERPRSVYAREALLKTGLIYFNNNQNEQAITQLKKVVEMYPGTPDAREAMNTLKVIYMDMNLLSDYIAFAQKMGMGNISNTEQDSLAFTIAENFYNEGRHEQALKALQQYIERPESGAYLLQAHHYYYQLLLKANQAEKALQSLEYIISIKGNPYSEQALLHAARIYYDQQNYEKAYACYAELYDLASTENERLEALEGKMKSAWFIGRYTEAIAAANTLKSSNIATQAQKIQAGYIAGKSLLENRQPQEALPHLSFVSKNDRSQFGAEAQFLIAKISYEQQKLQDTESQIFQLAEQFPSQEFWVAKGFLLLADVYVKQNNIFQAKETLKSIVDNYRGKDLKEEAARKLSMLQ